MALKVIELVLSFSQQKSDFEVEVGSSPDSSDNLSDEELPDTVLNL